MSVFVVSRSSIEDKRRNCNKSTLNILSTQTIKIFNQYEIVWDKSFRFSSFDNLHGNSGAYQAAKEMRHANITKP